MPTATEEREYREQCAAALVRLRQHGIKITEQFWSKGLLHVQVVLDGVPKTLTVPRDE